MTQPRSPIIPRNATKNSRRGVIVLVTAVTVGLFGSTGAAADVPSGYPDASNTGLSDPSVLQKHVGSITVTEDNTVIENLEIHGTLWIEANNVTVRNVWIYTSSFWTVYVRSGSLLIEHTEIGHPSHLGERGIGGSNVTGRYLDIHHVEDGIKLASNDLYEYVYIHDQASPNPAPHTDAVQADGGARNSIVRHSTLDCRGSRGLGNAAVILKSDLGSIDNILIENSYLNCGNYTFYSRNGGNGNPRNVTVRNNLFGTDHRYGFTSIDGSVAWTNNALTDGRPLAQDGSVPSGRFKDDDGNPHEAAINAIAAAGITKGCGPDSFCPNASVSRAEMAAFLVRALQQSGGSGSAFADVAPSAWYAGSAQRLYDLGITSGCATNPLRYCPTGAVSRAEIAAFLVRALNESPSGSSGSFSDVARTAWYAGYTERLAELGITKGCSKGKFCPSAAVTRAEMATLLTRAFDL